MLENAVLRTSQKLNVLLRTTTRAKDEIFTGATTTAKNEVFIGL